MVVVLVVRLLTLLVMGMGMRCLSRGKMMRGMRFDDQVVTSPVVSLVVRVTVREDSEDRSKEIRKTMSR